MKKIKFVKMVASGNDFVVIDQMSSRKTTTDGRLKTLARKICDRKFAAGADGLLVLERARYAEARMRIFNADGSEAEMCGNGARCAALFIAHRGDRAKKNTLSIETQAGIIQAQIIGDSVKVRLTDPKRTKLDTVIRIGGRSMRVNLINTGVPHAVVFSAGLDDIDIKGIARQIRYHKRFSPKGTNVDFVEVKGSDSIAIRTYERGVEDETLACGTGSVAAALVFSLKCGYSAAVKVRTKSREVLKVYFERVGNKIRNVWLEGKARTVYKGEYYV